MTRSTQYLLTLVHSSLVYTDILFKKIVVRESVLERNHRIGPDISAHYPSNRKLTKEENAAINEVLSLQPKLSISKK